MIFPFLKSKSFEPDFPIIPLNIMENEARQHLEPFGEIVEEEPNSNSAAIAQIVLVANDDETRVAAGIWNGRVRFTNYLTSQFNDTDRQRWKKLRWFVDYYGGMDQFDEPGDTGALIFLRNPSKKVLILFGTHMGPVRVIDEDSSHWTTDCEP